MIIRADQFRAFGNTGLRLPPIVFGAAALGNAHRVIPNQTKLAICGEWFGRVASPVWVDASPTRGRGRELEALARAFQRLDVAPEEVAIGSTLGGTESQISRRAVLASWNETCRLLGGNHRPQLVALDAPDEYLAAARSPAERGQRFQEILDAYRALEELKASRQVAAVGVAAHEWQVAREIDAAVGLDWVLLIGGFTIMRHPPELLDFMAQLAARKTPIVCAGVFHCNFLVGGGRFDGRNVRPDDPAERTLFAWRKAFAALCQGHGVSPAHACIWFALSGPGVAAVAINTSRPERIAENAEWAVAEVPAGLWASMREEGLLNYSWPL